VEKTASLNLLDTSLTSGLGVSDIKVNQSNVTGLTEQKITFFSNNNSARTVTATQDDFRKN
jgi:hypothetical protein